MTMSQGEEHPLVVHRSCAALTILWGPTRRGRMRVGSATRSAPASAVSPAGGYRPKTASHLLRRILGTLGRNWPNASKASASLKPTSCVPSRSVWSNSTAPTS